MADYVIYKRGDGTELSLRLNAARAVELEERLGSSLTEKMQEIDKLSTASEFIAAAVPEGDYKQRRETALAIYDEMIGEGKDLQEYQYLIFDILIAAGFLNGKAVKMQRELQAATQEAAEKRLAENLKTLQS